MMWLACALDSIAVVPISITHGEELVKEISKNASLRTIACTQEGVPLLVQLRKDKEILALE